VETRRTQLNGLPKYTMAGPPGFPPDLPGLPVTDLQYANARTYTSTVSVLLALSSVFVAMRLATRWKTSGFDAGDYLIVISLVCPFPVLDTLC